MLQYLVGHTVPNTAEIVSARKKGVQNVLKGRRASALPMAEDAAALSLAATKVPETNFSVPLTAEEKDVHTKGAQNRLWGDPICAQRMAAVAVALSRVVTSQLSLRRNSA